jgi:hypothetical protein
MFDRFRRKPQSDISGAQAAEAVRQYFETYQRLKAAKGAALLAILKKVSDGVGGEAVVIIDPDTREVHVHPDLALELAKPENEGLGEELRLAARSGSPPRSLGH